MIAKNNPFNIRYNEKNHWLGQVGHNKGFCVFKDLRYGIRAAMMIIRSYARRDILTIEEIIRTFAPPTENNTDKYIRFVVTYIRNWGVPVDTNTTIVPGSIEYVYMLQAMAFMETGTTLSITDIRDIFDMYLFNNSNR